MLKKLSKLWEVFWWNFTSFVFRNSNFESSPFSKFELLSSTFTIDEVEITQHTQCDTWWWKNYWFFSYQELFITHIILTWLMIRRKKHFFNWKISYPTNYSDDYWWTLYEGDCWKESEKNSLSLNLKFTFVEILNEILHLRSNRCPDNPPEVRKFEVEKNFQVFIKIFPNNFKIFDFMLYLHKIHLLVVFLPSWNPSPTNFPQNSPFEKLLKPNFFLNFSFRPT